MTKGNPAANLMSIWSDSIVHARAQIRDKTRATVRSDEACLFLGKMAPFFVTLIPPAHYALSFGIGPKPEKVSSDGFWGWVESEHPIPGEASFRAGRMLLDFFQMLRARNVRKLHVFISGGTSAMLWIPLTDAEILTRQLRESYRRDLSIAQLNRARAKLCALKQGGAWNMLQMISPQTAATVAIVSDVAPPEEDVAHAAEVAGGGPFFGAPARILFSNRDWRAIYAKKFRERILQNQWRETADWAGTIDKWGREIRHRVRCGENGILIWGCEPKIALPKNHGHGGRMSHLALELGIALRDELMAGRVEFLAASSDGGDGASGLAAVAVREVLPIAEAKKARNQFDSGPFFKSYFSGDCRLAQPTGFNVQDLILVRIKSPKSTRAN